MTEQELQRILREESNSVEWKTGGDPDKIVKTLAAFANDYEVAGSGFVVCGVEEVPHPDGRVTPRTVGISAGESKRLQDKIFNLSQSFVAPRIAPQFDSVPLDDGKEVLVVWIAASTEVHFFRKTVVVRRGDKVTDATLKQHSELAQRKARLDWLDQPCSGATLDDVDFFALEAMIQGARSTANALEVLQPQFRIFGSAPALTSSITSPRGDTIAPNRFAILLIGKEPHRFLPGAFVALTRFPGLTRADAVFSSNELFGPIPLLIKQVMGVLELEASVLTDKTQDFLNGAQNRKRYSLQALRELLVNALVHRDYQDRLSTRVDVFQDRIEFESPGGWVKLENIEAARQGRSRWRNPSLARYLVELGLAQERGTGIPKAIKETLAVAGAELVFEVDTWFKVTVPAYQPPLREPAEEVVNADAGVLLISIGYGTIDVGLVQRSHPAFLQISDERIRAYHYPGLVERERWPELIHEFRNWLRDCMETPRFQEFHLFYRGPVAVGPLIGALAAGRKPLIVYFYDEESTQYRFAYRVDRRLLQGS